jgi:hypothetical protein
VRAEVGDHAGAFRVGRAHDADRRPDRRIDVGVVDHRRGGGRVVDRGGEAGVKPAADALLDAEGVFGGGLVLIVEADGQLDLAAEVVVRCFALELYTRRGRAVAGYESGLVAGDLEAVEPGEVGGNAELGRFLLGRAGADGECLLRHGFLR